MSWNWITYILCVERKRKRGGAEKRRPWNEQNSFQPIFWSSNKFIFRLIALSRRSNHHSQQIGCFAHAFFLRCYGEIVQLFESSTQILFYDLINTRAKSCFENHEYVIYIRNKRLCGAYFIVVALDMNVKFTVCVCDPIDILALSSCQRAMSFEFQALTFSAAYSTFQVESVSIVITAIE